MTFTAVHQQGKDTSCRSITNTQETGLVTGHEETGLTTGHKEAGLITGHKGEWALHKPRHLPPPLGYGAPLQLACNSPPCASATRSNAQHPAACHSLPKVSPKLCKPCAGYRPAAADHTKGQESAHAARKATCHPHAAEHTVGQESAHAASKATCCHPPTLAIAGCHLQMARHRCRKAPMLRSTCTSLLLLKPSSWASPQENSMSICTTQRNAGPRA